MAGDKPKVFASAKLAWSDVFRVVSAMPAVMWAALILGLAYALVDILLVHRMGRPPSSFGGLLVQDAMGVTWAFFLTPLYLAIHRYIILGEVASGYTLAIEQPRFQRFFLCTLVIYALSQTPSLLRLFGHGGFTIAAMFVLTIVVAFVSVRLIVLFPAIAVDAPGASFRNAFDDSKGCFWRIFGILIVAMLPVLVVIIGVVISLGPLSAAGRLIEGVVNVLSLALAIAVASRLYLNLSDRLGRPGPGTVEVGAA
jgi:hypothetical protein